MYRSGYFNLFILFLIWPVINVFFSITMYLYLLMLNELPRNNIWERPYIRKAFISFKLIGLLFLLSTLSTPKEIDASIVSSSIILVQHLFWIGISLLAIKLYPRIDRERFLKVVHISIWILVLTFFFLQNTIFRNTLIFSLRISRNSFVYTLLIFVPFFSFYVYKTFGIWSIRLLTIILPLLMVKMDLKI